jgi:hypothetical protein
MRRAIRIGLFVTLCWFLGENRSEAQQPAKPSPTSAADATPTPIPLSDIDSQAGSAMESLREVEASLTADRITTAVEERLPLLAEEIALRTAENAKLLAASPALDLLHR